MNCLLLERPKLRLSLSHIYTYTHTHTHIHTYTVSPPPPPSLLDIGSNNSGYYELVAVLTHQGRSSSSGHYVGWVSLKNGRTWSCDCHMTFLHGSCDCHMTYKSCHIMI